MVIGGGNSGITIRSNAIVNGQTIGIRVGDFGGGSANTTTTVSLNRIKGHPTAGLQIESAANSYTGTLAAENNFWGCNTGPGTAGCDSVIPGSGTVDFNPWLQLTISAIPASFVNTNVAVNAYLTRNSDGADTSAAGTIPNGTPLTFATTCGTISPVPAPGQLSGGTARGLMRAPASPCTATVSATVDNATASAQVMIQAR
jgi:hypothetical protein